MWWHMLVSSAFWMLQKGESWIWGQFALQRKTPLLKAQNIQDPEFAVLYFQKIKLYFLNAYFKGWFSS